jgi:hypothetical protein
LGNNIKNTGLKNISVSSASSSVISSYIVYIKTSNPVNSFSNVLIRINLKILVNSSYYIYIDKYLKVDYLYSKDQL